MSSFRAPSAAGYFYPSNPARLKVLVESLLQAGQPEKEINNIRGIIAPHAGYIYSGKTAAYAYNLIKGKAYKTVVIISPSHREYFPGISVYDGDGYTTPFGNVLIDKETSDKIITGNNVIFKSTIGHNEEHAVEVHIPFLQSVMKDFKIIPIVMGDQSKNYIDALAERLISVFSEDMLLIASTDLSHYHNRKTADALDKIVEQRIADYDFNSLREDLEEERCEACGGGPVVVLMKVLDHFKKSKSVILNRTDSGEASGDTKQVVGYLSAVIYN